MSIMKAVILAAGAGTRMKSKLPKVAHGILDRSMVQYVVETAVEAGADEVCVVVGHGQDDVRKAIAPELAERVSYVVQEQQLGTGHAVMQAADFIGREGQVLVLFGDTPLITAGTLSKMIARHKDQGNGATVLSTFVEDPAGYGRIVRHPDGTFARSVEHKDASEEERRIREINSGMYCFEAAALSDALKLLTNDNAQGEYYLPDTVTSILASGMGVDAMATELAEEILGVNSRVQLAEAAAIMQKRINRKLMEEGATLVAPDQTWVGKDVAVGQDTIIHPGTTITGRTVIGEDCVIGPGTVIRSCTIGSGVKIEHSTLVESAIGDGTTVGPYAYIRPGCAIGAHVKVGDFVEIKNAVIGDGTKLSHLTYVGDADVGRNVNFGCGTVVVNYDGKKKHRTRIDDNAFIGCNTNLVAPVHVQESAYTAAGSTITKEVPAYALGVARARQTNIADWVKKKH